MKKIALFLLVLTGVLSSILAEDISAMALPALAERYAEKNGGSFRKASEEELAALRKLELPEPIVEFYKSHSPDGTIYGFVNLLPINEMLTENLGGIAPGKDVFPLGFVVFASMDGDVFCLDRESGENPRIVLFGHEEPFEGFTREMILQKKAKIVAPNLAEFFRQCLGEKLDREPRY